MKPKVILCDDNFGTILNCAVRYTLGRQSYMPKLVIDYITPMLPYLSQKTLWCLERDIKEYLACDKHIPYDIENDWQMFHHKVVSAIGKCYPSDCTGCKWKNVPNNKQCKTCERNKKLKDNYLSDA